MRSDAASSANAEDARIQQLALDPDEAAARLAQLRRARLRLTLALALLASAAALIALGGWTYQAVDQSLRELRSSTLKAVLDAQAKSLQVWIGDQSLTLRRLARDRQVREQVHALAAIAMQSGVFPEQYCAAQERRPLVEQLDNALAGSGAVAFNVVDRSARIIASKYREYCGLQMTRAAFERGLAPAFRGETAFLRPYADAERLEQLPSQPPLNRPLVWIHAPVLDDAGDVVAVIGVGHYEHEQFAAILAAARAGESAEVYAFDRNGMMLSESRFTAELVARGVLPPGGSAALALALRPLDAPDGVLTQLVQAARTGVASAIHDGTVLESYPGYLGRELVGAWRWLPAYDMGLAVEIAATEAFAPLKVLRTAFSVVFGALTVAVVTALAAWFSAAKMRSEAGQQRRLGAYLLGDRIGEGGVANVYLATHDLLKRPTAIKLLKRSRATDEMVARFEREAQLASQLSHPNMVEIFDYGRASDGTLFYAMEYLEGDTIGALVLRGGAMPIARALHLLRQVCAGLAEAHGKGLVHRDISATNIMVCRYGGEYDFVKILDFGLVKRFAGPHSQTVTRSLRVLGTPLYMAPERLRDPADVDARADIYAVGAVAFFMLTGRRMFDTLDELALTSKVLNEQPPRLSQAATQPIPPELDRIVAACLEKRREDRPHRVTELLDVFDSLARAARWTQRDAEAAWVAHRPAGAA